MRFAFLHVLRWLPVLCALCFVLGCAVPPAKPDEKKSSQVKVVNKQDQKIKVKKKKAAKKKTVKKQKIAKKQKPEIVAGEQGINDAGQEAEAENLTTAEPDLTLGRTMYHYDYYPDSEVYFDTIRHLYFYYDGGRWAMSVALPISFQKNLGASVRLKLDSPKPYLSHRQHREEYPSGTGGRGFRQ